MRTISIFLCALGFGFPLWKSQAETPPNIVFIFADDLVQETLCLMKHVLLLNNHSEYLLDLKHVKYEEFLQRFTIRDTVLAAFKK